MPRYSNEREEAVLGKMPAPHKRPLAEQADLRRQVRHLQSDLKRKEKALEETAALLVLRKEGAAIWRCCGSANSERTAVLVSQTESAATPPGISERIKDTVSRSARHGRSGESALPKRAPATRTRVESAQGQLRTAGRQAPLRASSGASGSDHR